MAQFLLLMVIALVVAALVFGVAALVTGSDPGLRTVEPDGTSRGLPDFRPLVEDDLAAARFDVAVRGYRMAQVDAAMARVAYDLGYKQEMIEALRAEVDALRDGRHEDAEVLRKAREDASRESGTGTVTRSAPGAAADTAGGEAGAADDTATGAAAGTVAGAAGAAADPGGPDESDDGPVADRAGSVE